MSSTACGTASRPHPCADPPTGCPGPCTRCARPGRERLDPAQLGLRAHEILEVTDRSELTGRGDYGSGTSLATARANLDGTRELITLLRPLLTGRYPDLPRLDAWLDRSRRTLDGFASDGTWTPLDRLGHQDRQRLNSDIGQAVELLAPVATICDPRRTA